MMETERILALQQWADGLAFSLSDMSLLDRALTHASTGAAADAPVQNYESLEFLGDAALGLAVGHYLYKRYPDHTPGEYSRMRASLVNRKVLARKARELNLAPLIRLGKGEELSGGRDRQSLLADCFEAVIGAIFLDRGWDEAEAFVHRCLSHELEHAGELDAAWDFKSRLQQYCQAEHSPLPCFEVVRSEGPDHRKEFEVAVHLDDTPYGHGVGRSKKEAEQQAAREALIRLGQSPDRPSDA